MGRNLGIDWYLVVFGGTLREVPSSPLGRSIWMKQPNVEQSQLQLGSVYKCSGKSIAWSSVDEQAAIGSQPGSWIGEVEGLRYRLFTPNPPSICPTSILHRARVVPPSTRPCRCMDYDRSNGVMVSRLHLHYNRANVPVTMPI